MDELQYKKDVKMAACSSPPWQNTIPPRQRPEILRQIRQEMLDADGYHLDECPKRLTCFKKSCLGRPLPWKSPTAQPYLEKLKETQEFKLNPITNELELIVQTNCRNCPIVSKCKSPCNQVIDFLERDKAYEPVLEYKDITENLPIKVETLEQSIFNVSAEDIPWEVLSLRRQQVVRKYLYEQRDYRSIAVALNLTNQSRVRYEFYAAVTKLSEVATIRQFLKEHATKLSIRQQEVFGLLYIDNLSRAEVSEKLGITRQSVQQTVARVLKQYNVVWKVYVKKHKNKMTFNVPGVFK